MKGNRLLSTALGLATGMLVLVAVSVPAAGAAPAASQSHSRLAQASFSKGQKCGRHTHIPCCHKKHAYSKAQCWHATAHLKTAIPVPGFKGKKAIHLMVKSPRGLDVIVTQVPNPLSKPKRSFAVSVSAINSKTGKALTTFKPAFHLSKGKACLWDSATSTCSAKSKVISKPGIYVVFP